MVGWEWGYWLSDVVAARASWNPHLNAQIAQHSSSSSDTPSDGLNTSNNQTCSNDSSNLSNSHETDRNTSSYSERDDQWEAYATALLPFTSIYGDVLGARLQGLLVRLARAQAELLVFGRVQGVDPPSLRKLSGMAYLSGNDPWIDLPRLVGLPILQPNKVKLRDTSDPEWPYAMRLLHAMEEQFSEFSAEMGELITEAERLPHSFNELQQRCTITQSNSTLDISSIQRYLYPITTLSKQAKCIENSFIINSAALGLLNELRDAMQLLALRAAHVHALYLSRDPTGATRGEGVRASLLKKSRGIIAQAVEVVQRREKEYRVPVERIASWRENPTVIIFHIIILIFQMI